jgi:maltooligosyltrehalose synthase
VAVAPRLVADLLDGPVLPKGAFAGTTIAIPHGGVFRDAITGEERVAREGRLHVDELFATLPIALLIR